MELEKTAQWASIVSVILTLISLIPVLNKAITFNWGVGLWFVVVISSAIFYFWLFRSLGNSFNDHKRLTVIYGDCILDWLKKHTSTEEETYITPDQLAVHLRLPRQDILRGLKHLEFLHLVMPQSSSEWKFLASNAVLIEPEFTRNWTIS